MQQPITPTASLPLATDPSSRDVLGEILHEGARQMLAQAIRAEVDQWLGDRQHLVDNDGRQAVVRNGHMPERTIQTPLGDMPIQQPRVRDRRPEGQRETFQSAILPPYLRRTRTIEQLLPWLYLKGISTGDMAEALQVLLGIDAKGLSATTVTRLKTVWQQEFEQWNRRDLSDKHYVYVWADGIHFNIRLEDADNYRQCILVLIGATADGTKELIAITDGYRESAQSWRELILAAQHQGLKQAPHVATADGALAFWKAAAELWPDTLGQRCWVHKTANVLNAMPKSVQEKAKQMLKEIWMAPTRAKALAAWDLFVTTFQAKYPGAVERLTKDRDALLTFYELPAEHWMHLRTTNPIESTFATVLRPANRANIGPCGLLT